jgi:hypothetical protein
MAERFINQRRRHDSRERERKRKREREREREREGERGRERERERKRGRDGERKGSKILRYHEKCTAQVIIHRRQEVRVARDTDNRKFSLCWLYL